MFVITPLSLLILVLLDFFLVLYTAKINFRKIRLPLLIVFAQTELFLVQFTSNFVYFLYFEMTQVFHTCTGFFILFFSTSTSTCIRTCEPNKMFGIFFSLVTQMLLLLQSLTNKIPRDFTTPFKFYDKCRAFKY